MRRFIKISMRYCSTLLAILFAVQCTAFDDPPCAGGKRSERIMGKVVKLKPGESHPHTLSVLEVQGNSAKVADHGRVIGWFKRGEWVSGDENWGGVKVISVESDEVVFDDSRIFLIP